VSVLDFFGAEEIVISCDAFGSLERSTLASISAVGRQRGKGLRVRIKEKEGRSSCQ
jgi:hypothetical protein